MEPLITAPDTTTFTPLAEHQSRTPSSFHTGPAILYYHRTGCHLVVLERDLLANPTLRALQASNPNGADAGTTTASTSTSEEDADASSPKELTLSNISVWVTSDKFLLYSPTTHAGLSIPYPSISLHAIQRLRLPASATFATSPAEEEQGLYMQIATPSAAGFSAEDDEEECTILTLVPPSSHAPEQQQQEKSGEEEEGLETETETPTQALYAAVSACSNLHPDPVEPGDEEEDDDEGEEGPGHGDSALLQSGLIAMGNGAGGLPPPMDGSSGWITAENMHEFFDEDGNWIGGGQEPTLSLGPGAGTVRQREEDGAEAQQDGDVNGEAASEETKWRRTD
ncbi:hypothetical protein ASPACDRAFT_1888445 [Aspergillus aculeatus ATCC 16872]|uniref:Regulator of volume decrease after cellular swelling-domain-containing protein n=1 Tax=Aspergillus aculeatus (strain ATCC 16872 / CBS 172.66 / WB 5094) TaxID=690307 RepID=A0A1L9WU93_ASPA1|nr:uncharacterized protein ASPACDRAFT_1888445 [Aspergillus aculeatus ATCC 16872]OJJ99780.1 hypothetical protein ASPACDRAFT_1888445 [Aspergillus aculeatus ATCC 16872]